MQSVRSAEKRSCSWISNHATFPVQLRHLFRSELSLWNRCPRVADHVSWARASHVRTSSTVGTFPLVNICPSTTTVGVSVTPRRRIIRESVSRRRLASILRSSRAARMFDSAARHARQPRPRISIFTLFPMTMRTSDTPRLSRLVISCFAASIPSSAGAWAPAFGPSSPCNAAPSDP